MHRVAFAATPAEKRQLEDLGVELSTVTAMPGGGDPFISFDIAEDDPRWLRLRDLLHSWGHSEGNVSTVSTIFTKKELDAARWLEIGAWHHGYPQPHDDEFGYRQATYDLSDWCEQCGIGMKQKAPFQMKGEPRWGRHAIMQLIWIYGELFVNPDVWTRVFKPAHVECRPVLNRRGAELHTVVQLVVPTTVSIVTDGLPFERCERCGRAKYLPVSRGPFPALRETPADAMVRTSQYFGSGGQADQRVLLAQDLARALLAGDVRGAALRPVAEPA